MPSIYPASGIRIPTESWGQSVARKQLPILLSNAVAQDGINLKGCHKPSFHDRMQHCFSLVSFYMQVSLNGIFFISLLFKSKQR